MKRDESSGGRRLAGLATRCQPDSRLVRLARDGHEQAFEEIVRRYRGQLVGFASGIVPEHHAEDVVQDALVKARAALGRSDADINLRPWLFVIVRNSALNALRDEPVHDRLNENFDGVLAPPDVAARREQLAALIQGVRDLPSAQREAIVKREFEGRGHEEIAAAIGTTPTAVRGLIYRARAALRDGAGMLIPMPVLRVLLGPGSGGPEAAGAAGAAAAGLAAGGGGGMALKAGATLGVAVIAVGSGLAIQHRSSKPGAEGASARPDAARSSHVERGGSSAAIAERVPESGHGGPGPSDSSGPGGGEGSSGSSSGPGPGPGPGDGPSGEGSGSGESGHGGGSGSGGDEGDDGGGTSGSGSSGSGSSGSDSSGSGDGSGSSGSDSSGSGDGTDSSGSGSSGSDSGGSGGGDETTTTIAEEDGGGTSGPG